MIAGHIPKAVSAGFSSVIAAFGNTRRNSSLRVIRELALFMRIFQTLWYSAVLAVPISGSVSYDSSKDDELRKSSVGFLNAQ